MSLKDVVITVNYPENTVVAAIPPEMTVDELTRYIHLLVKTEPDMTSFMVVAVPVKE